MISKSSTETRNGTSPLPHSPLFLKYYPSHTFAYTYMLTFFFSFFHFVCLSPDRSLQHSKVFNNKGKGDRTEDQKIIIHIPSHLKNTITYAHTHIHTNIYKSLQLYIHTRVLLTHAY